MDATTKPRVLIVYFSFTKQALTLANEMSPAFGEAGWDVHQASIEFTDPKYISRFAVFPMKHRYLDVIRMLWPQLRRKTGEIRIPSEADGTYDLVCIVSPTWWLTTCMPIRSFLKSSTAASLLKGTKVATVVVCRRYWGNNLRTVQALATEHGAETVDAIHFEFAGGQIRSFLSLVSFLGTGETRERYLGIKIPPSNLQAESLVAVREFAGRLATDKAAST